MLLYAGQVYGLRNEIVIKIEQVLNKIKKNTYIH